MRCITTFLVMVFILSAAGAQQLLKGKIYDKQTDSVLVATTIFNATKKVYALSAREGDYSIDAREGDKIIFTSVGYLPDTVKVLNYMIDAGYDVTMTLKNSLLKNVTVKSASYQQDSLNRCFLQPAQKRNGIKNRSAKRRGHLHQSHWIFVQKIKK